MNLLELIDEVMRDHELRKDVCKTIPLKRRGRREHRSPQTALISAAVEAKMLKRLSAEPRMTEVDEPPSPRKRQGT